MKSSSRYLLLPILRFSFLDVFRVEGWSTTVKGRFRGRPVSRLQSRLVDGKIVFDEDSIDDFQPKRTKRCFDFPPYYYKNPPKKDDKNKLRVKISSSLENQTVDEREAMPSGKIGQFTFRMMETIEKSATKTRLLDDRSYGSKIPFTKENMGKPPSLQDIATATKKSSWTDTFWVSLPARVITFVVAYFSFPYFSQVFNSFVTMQPDQLVRISNLTLRRIFPLPHSLVVLVSAERNHEQV